MKIKFIKSFTPLFFLFALIIASCSQPDIPEEELPPPPIEEVHSRTGRWTNIQDASDFITFTDDTTFIDEEGKRWNIDENEKKYYISLNSKKDIDFDQFNCVYLEGKGFYHKDDSPIMDDTNSTLRGGGYGNFMKTDFTSSIRETTDITLLIISMTHFQNREHTV